jgi:hypothetical protein
MARCEKCMNALISRSRIVNPISGTERMVSDWDIVSIDCKCNHETSIYREIDCQDWERDSDGGE